MWRSLVAHLHGVQGVEGSNPFTPTIDYKEGCRLALQPSFFLWVDAEAVLFAWPSFSLSWLVQMQQRPFPHWRPL